mgnify:CR=1 FL=1
MALLMVDNNWEEYRYMDKNEHLEGDLGKKDSMSFSEYFNEVFPEDTIHTIPSDDNPFSTGIRINSNTTTDWMRSFEDFCKFCFVGGKYLREKFKEKMAQKAFLKKYKEK